jgi:hypothetical protein
VKSDRDPLLFGMQLSVLVPDDWTRQALINEANRLYGRRPGGDR